MRFIDKAKDLERRASSLPVPTEPMARMIMRCGASLLATHVHLELIKAYVAMDQQPLDANQLQRAVKLATDKVELLLKD